MYMINGKEYTAYTMRFIGAWVAVNGTAEDMRTWLQWNDSNGDYDGMGLLDMRAAIKSQL